MSPGNIPDGPGREYSRRPGIFPIGPGIFPPAGNIPDGSEDKGVKGTFPVSGGNIPGGPGIYPRLARGHYHELAALKEKRPFRRPSLSTSPLLLTSSSLYLSSKSMSKRLFGIAGPEPHSSSVAGALE